MKLLEFQIRDTPPVTLVEAADLAEVVVLAGPNGVGKTRMLSALLTHFRAPQSRGQVRVKVAATTAEERGNWKGADTLDTADQAQARILATFLQRSKPRGSLRSGVLNFDSSRSFENIQPYSWNWDFQDPFEEAIGWDYTFQPVRNRFQDVIHSMLRKVRSHKESISDRAVALMAQGHTSMELNPEDPLAKFKEAFSRLLPGKTLLNLDPKTSVVQYMAGGAPLPLAALSSGEREVVTIVFDFLLRDPRDCIVVFDEPELHLHPELSYRLLRTLRESGERNQFVFCTHSPDIITASLDQTVIFVAPPSKPPRNQAITVREDDTTADVLNLLGQSIGVISLGRRLVLIEGDKTSLDKQTYGAIISAEYPELVLVPSGGKGAITTFVGALDGILSKALWGIEWFMLADGDAAASLSDAGQYEARSGGRLKLLPRYHLENYFLDEQVMATVFETLEEPPGSWLRDPTQIRLTMREIAAPFVPLGAALRVAHARRQAAGNVDLMPRGVHGLDADALVAAFDGRRAYESERLNAALDSSGLADAVRWEFAKLAESLAQDSDDWKRLLPGKAIVNAFAAKTPIDVGTLKRLYIRAANGHAADPFAEIRSIFAAFSAFPSGSGVGAA